MMQFRNMRYDIARLHFIPFPLKNSMKKCMHSLLANSISSWDGFVGVFLRKYFPDGKTMKLGNEINRVVQFERESFWKCFELFKILLAYCPHHGLEHWRLC